MSIGITEVAKSVRNMSAADIVRIRYSHALELTSAALGHRTFDAFQIAQAVGKEPQHLRWAGHIVLDFDLVEQRARKLGIEVSLERLQELLQAAFAARSPMQRHDGFTALERAVKLGVEHDLLANPEVLTAIGGAQNEDQFVIEVDYKLLADEIGVGEPVRIDVIGRLSAKATLIKFHRPGWSGGAIGAASQ